MAAVVLSVPGWEELSYRRRGPRPCDPCPENTPQAPSSLHLFKSCLPFSGDLPETALAFRLPAGNIPWFLCCPQEKGRLPGPALWPFVRPPSPAWVQTPTLQPCRSPSAWCSLHISAHAVPSAKNAFPSPPLPGKPGLLLASPSVKLAPKSTGQATSPTARALAVLGVLPPLTHILSQNIHQFMGLVPHQAGECSSLSPVPSTEFGDDNDN